MFCQGYVHIRTDRANMVVPVELDVCRGGVDPTPTEVDFGVLTSPSERRQASVSLFNRFVYEMRVSTPFDCEILVGSIGQSIRLVPYDTSHPLLLFPVSARSSRFEESGVLLNLSRPSKCATIALCGMIQRATSFSFVNEDARCYTDFHIPRKNCAVSSLICCFVSCCFLSI